MTRSWLLTALCATVLAIGISAARGETCPASRVHLVTRMICERVAGRLPVCEPRMFVECVPEAEARQ